MGAYKRAAVYGLHFLFCSVLLVQLYIDYDYKCLVCTLC